MEKIKVGEGSRGGKIIGHTKSGKPIYQSPFISRNYSASGYGKVINNERTQQATKSENEEIEKAKYTKREGTPGNYKYTYGEENKTSSKKIGQKLDMQVYIEDENGQHMGKLDVDKFLEGMQTPKSSDVYEAIKKYNETHKEKAKIVPYIDKKPLGKSEDRMRISKMIDVLEKAKYTSRTGTPGHYKYTYDNKGNTPAKTNEPKKETPNNEPKFNVHVKRDGKLSQWNKNPMSEREAKEMIEQIKNAKIPSVDADSAEMMPHNEKEANKKPKKMTEKDVKKYLAENSPKVEVPEHHLNFIADQLHNHESGSNEDLADFLSKETHADPKEMLDLVNKERSNFQGPAYMKNKTKDDHKVIKKYITGVPKPYKKSFDDMVVDCLTKAK